MGSISVQLGIGYIVTPLSDEEDFDAEDYLEEVCGREFDFFSIGGEYDSNCDWFVGFKNPLRETLNLTKQKEALGIFLAATSLKIVSEFNLHGTGSI